jgi:hypothetical protein
MARVYGEASPLYIGRITYFGHGLAYPDACTWRHLTPGVHGTPSDPGGLAVRPRASRP